jgi:hypothetical protein
VAIEPSAAVESSRRPDVTDLTVAKTILDQLRSGF